MASEASHPEPHGAPVAQPVAMREALARRAALLRDAPPAEATSPSLRLLLGELSILAEPVRRALRGEIPVETAAQRKVVILLPGFATHPLRMRYMARQLERAGHKVKRWGQGFNFGPTEANFAQLAQRVLDVRERYGQPVVLVGWSLGGIFAREIAKLHPEAVEKVITMGSPFSGSPYSNNAWRIYQLITGHSVTEPPVKARLAEKPPVETVALWSARDGVVSPRCACGRAGERDRAVALRCTHLGFSNSPECIRAVLQELARP